MIYLEIHIYEYNLYCFFSKHGNRTHGIDKETLDGINFKFFVKLAKASGEF